MFSAIELGFWGELIAHISSTQFAARVWLRDGDEIRDLEVQKESGRQK